MKIAIDSKYILAFLFLTMLCGLSHEMVHHLTGAAICGCWGYKTFNSFVLCDACTVHPIRFIATAAGPLFTFGLMWFGWYQLRRASNKYKQLGFALIFANFPINRIMYAFMGWNDEQFIARSLFGESVIAFWTTIFIVLALSVPPLVAAYLSIQNRNRWLWFLGFFILPFVFVVLFAGLFLEDYVLLQLKVLAQPFLGVPLLLWLTEIIVTIGYVFTKKYIYHKSDLAMAAT